MKAFISYSHSDTAMLENLHKHLTQLQRDRILQTWEDREIMAGGRVENQIFKALEESQLFLALLSPDYIASRYCFEKEFEKALALQERDKLIIIPIIVEPCDWLNTPFNKFKALPKDGKAVSTWENKNTAFLDVIQNIRKLLTSSQEAKPREVQSQPENTPFSRNYRVKKDFDSIEKLEFTEKTFHEVKEFLKRYIEEVIQIDNVKARIINESEKLFECWLVNRNKINTEGQLKVSIGSEIPQPGFMYSGDNTISYSITNTSRPVNKSFSLAHDEFQMYWSEANFYSHRNGGDKFDARAITDAIWNAWLESVGIL